MHVDKGINALYSWAVANGCRFNSSYIGTHPVYGGYGIFNSDPWSGDESDDDERTALFIPESLIISIDLISETANEVDELAQALNALPSLPSLEPVITTFLLYQLHLQRAGKESKWSTYLEFLPKSPLLPINWNDSEVALLQECNTSISGIVPAKFRFMKSIFTDLKESSSWFQSITWEDFILAESWVASRSIRDPSTDTPTLVPILDMVNHSASRNAAWEVTDEGIELRREPVHIEAELAISYDLDRGTAERLYRYGFIEDTAPDACSKKILLFESIIPAVPGGHVYRISLTSVNNAFQNLSFLTYENWLAILPTEDEPNQVPRVHVLCRPIDKDSPIRLCVSPPEGTSTYHDVGDLMSLVGALHHDDTFFYARRLALLAIARVVELSLEEMKCPKEYDEIKATEEYVAVRKEVYELIRMCTMQEKLLLQRTSDVLKSELAKIQ